MQQRKKSARLACLLAAVSVCLVVVGCGANFEDAEEGSGEGLGETNEALPHVRGRAAMACCQQTQAANKTWWIQEWASRSWTATA
jgi:hypothetical protein